MMFQLRDAEDENMNLTAILRALETAPEESDVQCRELQETKNQVRP